MQIIFSVDPQGKLLYDEIEFPTKVVRPCIAKIEITRASSAKMAKLKVVVLEEIRFIIFG